MVKFKYSVIGVTALIFLNPVKASAQATIWKLDDLAKVGNYTPQILGKPSITKNDNHTAVYFNGVNDGLVVPKTPIEGLSQFTIELLFKPDGDGPVQPRLIHFQDGEATRGTLEIRLTPEKQWYMDAFLRNGKVDDKGLTLIDSTQLHPTDRWYWMAMVFDGKNMSSYVNGVKQLSGVSNFPAMKSGQISIGVRLNKVNWFKGAISEIRVSPEALAPSALQKLKE